MSLKFRYAAFLLLVFLLLLGFCAVSLHLVSHGRYILTAMLLIVLYFSTYMLGKRFARIFFILSVLRLLRKNGGSLTHHELDIFFEKTLAGRRSDAEKRELKSDILTTLVDEKEVAITEETTVLLNHEL